MTHNLLTIILLSGCFITSALAGDRGWVNFTGMAPQAYEKQQQPLTVFACNNTAVSLDMQWGTDNIREVPFGLEFAGDQPYFISKYYIASPPLPNQFVSGTPLILGVLSQDHFRLDGGPEMAEVFMDYRLLKPVQLGFLPVSYQSSERGEASCLDLGINQIPINIRCPEFEYTAYGQKITGQKKGLGKGIGQLARVKTKTGELKDHGQLFIPLDVASQKPLKDCTVEIVNDIMFAHQVFFGKASDHQSIINLTQAYERHQHSGESVGLYCRPRPVDQPAAGCVPLQPLNEFD